MLKEISCMVSRIKAVWALLRYSRMAEPRVLEILVRVRPSLGQAFKLIFAASHGSSYKQGCWLEESRQLLRGLLCSRCSPWSFHYCLETCAWQNHLQGFQVPAGEMDTLVMS